MAMRVLVDTNILLDYLLDRKPYAENARTIVKACQQKKIYGCIAAHSITNIFYILRKAFNIAERREMLLSICELFDVEKIDKTKVQNALANDVFLDFEDCLQVECAMGFQADYIVTRNMGDFSESTVPCIAPAELCEKIVEL